MSDSYHYIDPDFAYTDPTTELLRNLQGITDPDVLVFVESAAVTKRLQELYDNPIRISGVDCLFKVHRLLFQDIYAWAGEKRTVEISKDGKRPKLFCEWSMLDKVCQLPNLTQYGKEEF